MSGNPNSQIRGVVGKHEKPQDLDFSREGVKENFASLWPTVNQGYGGFFPFSHCKAFENVNDS